MEDRNRSARLSERERQLLTLAAKGLTDAAIGEHLKISETTVKSYWGRVRMKLGPRNRTELVALALAEERQNEVEHLQARVRELEHRLLRGNLKSSGPSLYEIVLAQAPDAVLVVDPSGLVLYANREAEHIFGYSVDDFLGMEINRLIPPRLRDRHKKHLQGYQIEPAPKRMGDEFGPVALDKVGNEFPISATISMAQTDAGPLILCFVRLLRKKSDPLVDRYGIPRF